VDVVVYFRDAEEIVFQRRLLLTFLLEVLLLMHAAHSVQLGRSYPLSHSAAAPTQQTPPNTTRTAIIPERKRQDFEARMCERPDWTMRDDLEQLRIVSSELFQRGHADHLLFIMCDPRHAALKFDVEVAIRACTH
jgi:hypothetical protein